MRAAGTVDFGNSLIAALGGLVDIEHCVLVKVMPRHADIAALASRQARHVATRLTEAYVGGYYREDPLVREFSCTESASLAAPVVRPLALNRQSNVEYYERFFIEPGIADKLSIVAPGSDHTAFLSLYKSTAMGRFSEREKACVSAFGDLLAALASTHTKLLSTPSVPREVSIKWHTALSERERSVARLLGRGETAKTVGAMLALSPASVVTYKQRALAKLGIGNQRELVALAALLG
ncbi:response regulator transcription factor [Caballeronia insecticola]|uniref:Transcriptional regulatory protein n=1 Tax=Caballeronia insecticola TaxID=758793 RepID=R4WNQ8_9BURK|nr:helix-turn-helix transcriptional regulator [Caballeronia insecticola]BAN26238.1 transcriptional regulatory protein [Caballeronia insecticola]